MRPSKKNLPIRISWVRIGDIHPDMRAELNHFVALDAAGADIGIVRRIEHGPERGWWLWSMTRVHPGPPLNIPRSGTTETRGEAEKALVGRWRRFRRYYRIED